jgi:hypothetical protein
MNPIERKRSIESGQLSARQNDGGQAFSNQEKDTERNSQLIQKRDIIPSKFNQS